MTTDLSILQPLLDGSPLASISVDSFEQQSRALVVDDQFTYDLADQLLGGIKVAEKAADKARDERYQVVKSVEAYIMGDVRTMITRLKAAGETVKAAMLGYSKEQKRIAAEAQAVADKAAREERERLAKAAAKAEKKGDVEKAASLQAIAAVVVAPTVTPTFTQAKGSHVVTAWKARIAGDEADAVVKLAAHIVAHPEYAYLLKIDVSAATKLAKMMGAKFAIPGLEAHEDETLAKRVA